MTYHLFDWILWNLLMHDMRHVKANHRKDSVQVVNQLILHMGLT